MCGRCHEARYCDVTCQRADWTMHKRFCHDEKTRAEEKHLEKILYQKRLDFEGASAAALGTQFGFPDVKANCFYVVCDMMRDGASEFCQHVEFTHYAPCECRESIVANKLATPLADLVHTSGCAKDQAAKFDLHMVPWQGMLFAIIAVPLEDKHVVMNSARTLGMKICDGVPTIMSKGGTILNFPLQGRNVCSLENRERPATSMPREEQLAKMKDLIDGKKTGNGQLVMDLRGGK